MRVVIQRVVSAAVSVKSRVIGSINNGLLVFVGIEDADTEDDIRWMVNKIIGVRIFNDSAGVMNLKLSDVKGELLVVSQFTLHASTKKGNRPSYIRAAKRETAIPLYEKFCAELETGSSLRIQRGEFGADMKVELINDGPVTILIDSKNRE
ncbi:MAG TPA: D-aminoacyl-tRNA deacylase [Flavitalea sp.]|nr:D-aminoacyl-tRNA deacylase [Flavitalea sp.]